MKISNNYQNIDLTKTVKEETKQSERFPDSIAKAPDLTPGGPDRAKGKTESTANSESAKLKGAAEDALSRAAIENQFGKETKSNKSSKEADATPATPVANSKLKDLDYNGLLAHTANLIDKVDFSKLENVKEVVKAIAPEIKESQLDRLIGSGVNTGAAKETSLRDLAGQGRDRAGELTGNKLGDLRMVGGALVSEDPKAGSEGGGNTVESPSVKDIIINFFLGQASGRSQPLPLPPTPPDPETGKNMWDGVSFIKNVLGTGNYENNVNQRGGIDTNGTPNPDAADTGGPRYITREMLIGIATRLGSKGEPNPESQAGSGGPVNETKASGGATGPAGEPAMEIDRAIATSRDMDALRIKLESKFIKP